MITKIEEILSTKNESGENAYLWLQSAAGDCILWPTEEASENEDTPMRSAGGNLRSTRRMH